MTQSVAIHIHRHGDAEVLSDTVVEVPPPEMRPGAVRIAVRAAALNFADLLMVVGKYQEKPELPFVPGMEAAGEVLDGEGGYTVWGKFKPAADSLAQGALPLGLAHGVKLKAPVAQGEPLRWSDVEIDETDATVAFRREMERDFRS